MLTLTNYVICLSEEGRLAFLGKDPTEVDADLYGEAISSGCKGQSKVTTEQAPDRAFLKSFKNANLEDKFCYNMNHPERGCFIIFNQEVSAFCPCNLFY